MLVTSWNVEDCTAARDIKPPIVIRRNESKREREDVLMAITHEEIRTDFT